jgi:hypothetical protein
MEFQLDIDMTMTEYLTGSKPRNQVKYIQGIDTNKDGLDNAEPGLPLILTLI